MSEAKHSPTPWGIYITQDRSVWVTDATGRMVAEMVAQKHPAGVLANAEQLCAAVNAHHDLLAACEAVLAQWGRDNPYPLVEAVASVRRAVVAAKGGAP